MVLVFVAVFYMRERGDIVLIRDFATCVDNGFPVMESDPRQCKTPDGKTFVEEKKSSTEVEIDKNIDKPQIGIEDMIRVVSPTLNAIISSPFSISGEARGQWFFEGSFPAKLLDANGKEIAVIPITAQGEWMTTDFVPFSGSMMFGKVNTKKGTLVLQKDNPSGLIENSAQIEIPIIFDPALVSDGASSGTKECRPTGCSGQLCADQDLVSTCEFKNEYACYSEAECKLQNNGECGWTQTEALSLCIQTSKK